RLPVYAFCSYLTLLPPTSTLFPYTTLFRSTQGGQVLESLYEELGAGSESIAFDELYNALDQGVVDGEENTWSNIESKKFDEVQDYTTELNHTRVDYAVFTNTEFWDGLNDETKEIVEDGLEKDTEVER